MGVLQAGGILQLEDNDVLTSYAFGPFAEYNFTNESQWMPYVGISGLWFGTDPGEGDSQDSLVARGSAGVKYFVTDVVAIFGSANFDWSPDDLFLDEDLETNDTQFLFELGVRFYIGR